MLVREGLAELLDDPTGRLLACVSPACLAASDVTKMTKHLNDLIHVDAMDVDDAAVDGKHELLIETIIHTRVQRESDDLGCENLSLNPSGSRLVIIDL